MVGIKLSRIKLSFSDKHWSPLKRWSLFSWIFFTNKVDCIFTHNSQVFKHFFNSLEIVLMKIITIFMMSAKVASARLLKLKIFWNKGYDVIVSVHGVTSRILSSDSNDMVDVIMLPKFGNTSKERSYHNLNFIRTWPEKPLFFKSWSFDNLGLALGMALKFYTSLAKMLKIKSRKFWGTNSYVCRSCRKKAGKWRRGLFAPPHPE